MIRCVVLSLLLASLSAPEATAAEQPLRAGVNILAAETKPAETSMPANAAPPPAANAPRAAIPDYRDASRSRRAAAPDHADAPLRFLIPLPERPILVEAQITVDGRPYRALREARIDRLITELSTPENPQEGDTAVAPEGGTGVSPAASAEPAQPGVPEKKAAPAVDNSPAARLRRYAQATGRRPTRDEVQWFLTNWGDGPTLLVLDENFQRVRAGQSPVVIVLDRDDDGAISSAELASAQERLLLLDTDRNGVVAYEELFEAADGLLRGGRVHRPDGRPTPLVPFDDLQQAQANRALASRYSSPPAAIDQAAPDLRLDIAFSTQDPSHSKIEARLADSLASADVPAVVRDSSITLRLLGAILELSIVQTQGAAPSDQVSIGAVDDGYPFLPEIDPSGDGKLTVRELRNIASQLAVCDYNRDGALSADEILPTIRVAVGLGPTVHRHLSALRKLPSAATPSAAAPPDWFARMDKNQDRDLTRSEFLGTDEQFAELDADQDQLVDAAEAARDAAKALTAPPTSTVPSLRPDTQP